MTIFLSAGCGAGSGQGLDEDGNLVAAGAPAGGGGVGASGNPNATLAWVQRNVFGDVNVCSKCHTGASAPMGVNWSSSVQTCANVGRVSGEIPSLVEIAPGNPEASYVIWKVEGRAGIVGGRMPLGDPPLTPDTIKNMRDWIADGVPGCP